MKPPIQLPLGVRLRDDATFINYYPGANAAALGYVERLCEADAGWTESLIYLWGKQGVGRSHLLQAATHRFQQRGEPAVYLPLAQLLDRGVEVLDYLAQYELVCIDDLHVIAGKADWEEAMFHLFNRLRDSDPDAAAGLAGRLRELGEVLGVLQLEAGDFLRAGAEGKVDAGEVEGLIQARLQARADKNWAESDRIRDQLTAMGVVLEDSKGSTTWRLAD
ncbi:hypothetical protein CVV67_20580 [Arthrobacter stackebrandtii]|nr:hypothetical protein CVV67_20580 [Arthrobacter stackebrandtii]